MKILLLVFKRVEESTHCSQDSTLMATGDPSSVPFLARDLVPVLTRGLTSALYNGADGGSVLLIGFL